MRAPHLRSEPRGSAWPGVCFLASLLLATWCALDGDWWLAAANLAAAAFNAFCSARQERLRTQLEQADLEARRARGQAIRDWIERRREEGR